MKGWQALPGKCCGNCKYFRKHYVRLYKGTYRSLDYGHCVHPRLKKRRAEEHCQYWSAAEEQ